MPIGVWLSEQIRHASEQGPAPSEQPAAVPPPSSNEEIHRPADDHRPQDHSSQERQRSGHVDPRFAFGRGQWSVAEEAVGKGMVAHASNSYPWQFRPVPQPAAPSVTTAPPVPANSGYPPPIPQVQQPAEQMPAPVPHVPQQTGLSREDAAAMEGRVDAVEGRLRDLQQRINSVEDKTLARFEPVLAKIEALTAELDRIDAKPAMIADGDASFSTAPIERAVMRLSERLGRVEQTVLPGSRNGRGFFSRLFRRG